jgi:redox-sensitive bicupin YhaK (pirin superfamily)
MGEGHTAVPVVDPQDYMRSDPFIVLMDDRMDLPPGSKAGDAHPHAGFEIATFLVEGELRDRDEGVMRAGDVNWMTAGSGVIHNEDVVPLGRSRILQLWFRLPSVSKSAPPRMQQITRDAAPVRRGPGVEAHVYAGTSGEARSPIETYAPITMVDIHMATRATFRQELPATYNGFIYVLEGDVSVGTASPQRVKQGQVGWLDEPPVSEDTVAHITAGNFGARLVLYAGEPQRTPLAMHGPFIGETRADLMRISQDYMQGRMPRVSQLGVVG